MRNVYHVSQKIRRKAKILVPRNQIVSFIGITKCSVCENRSFFKDGEHAKS
jgi:hypothetical protein